MTAEEMEQWLRLRARGLSGGFSPAEKAAMERLDRLFDEHEQRQRRKRPAQGRPDPPAGDCMTKESRR